MQSKNQGCLVERFRLPSYASASMLGSRPQRRRKSAVAVALGKVLRARREGLQITQERFAEKVDLSKNYIGSIERGEYEVAISTLQKIATVLGTKASELVREAGY